RARDAADLTAARRAPRRRDRVRRSRARLPRARAREEARAAMTGALLRKELRELLPWAILGVAVSLVDLTELIVQQVDMRPLGQTVGLLNDFDSLVYWLIAFAIGTGLV